MTEKSKGNFEKEFVRSRDIVTGDERASHRGYLRAVGVADEEMGKPLVGTINSWNEFHPGHAHLLGLAQEVKAGVWAAGGFPFEINTISLCDGLSMGHEGMKWVLPSRDLMGLGLEPLSPWSRMDGFPGPVGGPVSDMCLPRQWREARWPL